MQREKQRGFVGSELFIVLAIFSVFCLIVAFTMGQMLRLSLSERLLTALGLFVVGIAFLVGGAIISEWRRPPILPAKKNGREDDAPPNP